MWQKLISLIMAITLLCVTSRPIHAREMSKSGLVFNQVKDGVVSIISNGHGSGFVVDDSGLILTNSHVVRNNDEHIRVSFGPGYVVRGQVVEKDREADLAIVRVNLANIPTYKVLPFFTPKNNEPLVLTGEKVIAVGSPLDWPGNERSMTHGTVGKYESEIIDHDADIYPGNSGGPLLNFDGEVVGINTFLEISDYGGGIPNSVAVTKAVPLVSKAKKTARTLPLPSPKLLPDTPRDAYPMGKFLREFPKKFPKRKQKHYMFESRYFAFSVITPPQGYYQLIKTEEKVLKKRRKRGKKKGFDVTEDEYDSKNMAFYETDKPVVSIFVSPKPKLTTGSIILNTVSLIGATALTVASFGATAPLLIMPFLMGKHEIKKDFLQMTLADKTGTTVCEPYLSARVPFEANWMYLTGMIYEDFIDKSYMGMYEFDAHCFEGKDKLNLVIDIEGITDDDRKVSFPSKTKRYIVGDFDEYWDYIAEKKEETIPEQVKTIVKTTTTDDD